ncbi:Uncharacterised protein [Mycobacteroides abscessus subsp. massiliense]|nr:Uncharacterised protein [Mycobacteroides abscessus subsp. massiliense]
MRGAGIGRADSTPIAPGMPTSASGLMISPATTPSSAAVLPDVTKPASVAVSDAKHGDDSHYSSDWRACA